MSPPVPTTPVSKSSVIREILASRPRASMKEIQAELARRQVKASIALVNKIKYGPSPSNGKPRVPTDISVDHLLAAKRFVELVGGVDIARHAIEALEKVLRH